MAKRKSRASKVKAITPPFLAWTETATGWFAEVTVANIIFPLEERPFKGFHKGERDAILTFIKMALSEVLFDYPCYIVNNNTQKFVVNPDWRLLPYHEPTPDGKGYVEVKPEATPMQLNVEECLTT